MKKINLAKKALLPALIAVICSVVALTSVSYAWFTLGDEAQVSNIDVNVTEADGIQISFDGKTWKSIWDSSQMEEYIEHYGNALSPVSTKAEYNNGFEFFAGGKRNDKLELREDTAENYYYFDVYVRLDQDKLLQLADTSSVESGDGKYSDLSARVAFVNLGTIGLNEYDVKKLDNLTGLNGGDNEATDDEETNYAPSVIWEPNSKEHYSSNRVVEVTDKLRYEAAVLVDGEIDTTKTMETFDFINGLSSETLFDLDKGYTKIRVYIWLEGQDADNHNEIAEQAFNVSLVFKAHNHEYEPETDKCACGLLDPEHQHSGAEEDGICDVCAQPAA